MESFEISFLVLFLTLVISGCAEKANSIAKSGKDVDSNGTMTSQQPTSRTNDDSGCDPSLWGHVYNPSRLKIIEQCKTVTGVIKELDQNEDGDTHMLLKLDAGQENLLLKKNVTKKDGNLVIEIVCANAITDKKVDGACQEYTNKIKIPKVGDHVRVTGSYVDDSHNDWAEIHPISSIEKL